ncbi:unnamed protein product [Gongylonema pulchrum]|uniref:Helicase C-terminal domain-containing protein n=1 Tax=Gongylonema pulchrum TaxID=637853 RepID=A0A3P7PGQ6_9BILA|nr:unnamed protein product [Gongylonema pulchrum]
MAEERLRTRLEEINHSVKVKILCLYGQMHEDDRAEVFAPLEPGYHHKVIFTTNVAETSITIPGVRYIVDCGLAKVKKFDAVRRISVVDLDLISKVSAEQRAGRAGRTAPGVCFRLYSKKHFDGMTPTNNADIVLSNLAEVVLYMVSVGIENPESFDFIEKPNPGLLMQALKLLR